MSNEPPTLLTPGAAARLLGVSVDTLRRWADTGRIAVVVLPSGHRRFRPEDVDMEQLLVPSHGRSA